MAFLHLRRNQLRVPTRALLALNLLFAAFLLTLCLAVTLNQPVHRITWLPIVLLTIVFATLLSEFHRGSSLWSLLPTLIVIVLAIALVSGGAIRKHLFISVFPDTWAYCSFAEFLEHNARTVSSGLPPIEQFGSHLRDTRFGAASFLAFLAEVTRGNPATVLVWFSVFVSANIFAGFTVWCRVLKCPASLSLGAGFFAVACSWGRDAIVVGNLDNLLFMAILPYSLARFLLFTRGPKKGPSIVALALNMAVLSYVYPEGVVIGGVLSLPFLVGRVSFDIVRRHQIRAYIVLAVTTIVLIGPYIGIFCSFLIRQLSAAGAGARPGTNIFAGLLSAAWLPAIFGLGQEFIGTRFSNLNNFLPSILVLLITAAAFCWWRTDRGLFFCLPLLILFAAWQGGFQKYDYGLFKTLFIGSAYWIPAIFVGLNASGGRLLGRQWRPLQILFVVLLAAWAFLEKRKSFDRLQFTRGTPMKSYQELSQIHNVVGEEGVTLKFDSAFDQEWGIFFLRDVPLKIAAAQGYLAMPHVLPVMVQAKYASGEPNFILTDARYDHAIWHNQKFWLVPRDKYVRYDFLGGPSGLGSVLGRPLVWIGNKPTTFEVESRHAKLVWFYSQQGWLGPSLPEAPVRTIVVETGDFRRSIVTTGPFSIELPVEKGKNRVKIWCEDKPSVITPGDPNALLFGLWDFQFESLDGEN